MTIRVDGIDDVLRDLNREISGIKNRSRSGLMAAGLKVEAESKRRVPREYGNLVNSAYTRRAPDNPDAVEIGYSAEYAVYVHENMEQRLQGEPRPSGLGVYWGPSGQPKYLESALRDLQGEILETIRQHARVTGTIR